MKYAILRFNFGGQTRTFTRPVDAYKGLPMIFDSLEHAGCYFTGDWWDETLAYIRTATTSLPDGVHQVRGEAIVARVHSGKTRRAGDSVPESHLAYVDVHVVLDGRETIAVWPADRLTIRTPYDKEQDVMFYASPAEAGLRLNLQPGFFAVFFPQDAHMTQIAQGEPEPIKKLVMKISVGLVGNPPAAGRKVRNPQA